MVPVGGGSVELGILANNPDEICLDAGHIPKLSASPLAQLGVVASIPYGLRRDAGRDAKFAGGYSAQLGVVAMYLAGIRPGAGFDLKLGVQAFAQLDISASSHACRGVGEYSWVVDGKPVFFISPVVLSHLVDFPSIWPPAGGFPFDFGVFRGRLFSSLISSPPSKCATIVVNVCTAGGGTLAHRFATPSGCRIAVSCHRGMWKPMRRRAPTRWCIGLRHPPAAGSPLPAILRRSNRQHQSCKK